MTLLPHELHLLRACWVKSGLLPARLDMSPAGLRTIYAGRLADEIAAWLADGLLGWQYPLRHRSAFLPIAWLIGTRADEDSYLDSLVALGRELGRHAEPEFARIDAELRHEAGQVELGSAFADGAARAVLRLAASLAATAPGDGDGKDEALRALLDALELVQRLEPARVVTPLGAAWNLLFGSSAAEKLPLQEPREALCLQQAFVRALIPAMHTGRGDAVLADLLAMFERAVGTSGVPAAGALVEEIVECRERLRGAGPAVRPPRPPRRRAGPLPPAPQPAEPAKPARWGIALSGRSPAATEVTP